MQHITIVLAALCAVVVRGHSTCVGCHTHNCGENEVPVTGHARRDRFCRPAYTRRELLTRQRKCICKPRYVRNSWDECVPTKLCRRCKCRLQKDWHLCSSACPVTYNMTVPFCRKMCVPGCDCPPGWVVDSRNWKRCVKAIKFPPICPPHSTFQPCVSSCSPRCGITTPKTCVTSCHRGACLCDNGFAELWGYGGRSCVRQEKCEWHLRNLFGHNWTVLNAAGVGLHGGAIQPGGLIMGSGGALVPSAIGILPAGAGLHAGGASLIGPGGGGPGSLGVRGGGSTISLTGGTGASGAGISTVGVGANGGGVIQPASTVTSAAGTFAPGTSGNGLAGVGVSSINGGAAFGGSGASVNMGGASLNSGTGVGGSAVGVNAGSSSLSGNAGFGGASSSEGAGVRRSGMIVNTGGASLSGGATLGGTAIGIHSGNPLLSGGGRFGGSIGSVTAGGGGPGVSINPGVASVNGGAGSGVANGGVHGVSIPSVTMGSGGGSLGDTSLGIHTSGSGGRISTITATSAANTPLSNAATFGMGRVGVDSMGTGSGSGVGFGSAGGSLLTGGTHTTGTTASHAGFGTSGAGVSASGFTRGHHSGTTSSEARHPSHIESNGEGGGTGSDVSNSGVNTGSGGITGRVHVGGAHSSFATTSGIHTGTGASPIGGSAGGVSGDHTARREEARPSGAEVHGGRNDENLNPSTHHSTSETGGVGVSLHGTGSSSTAAAVPTVGGTTAAEGGSTSGMTGYISSGSGTLPGGPTVFNTALHGRGGAGASTGVSPVSGSTGSSGLPFGLTTGHTDSRFSMTSGVVGVPVGTGNALSRGAAAIGVGAPVIHSALTHLHGAGGHAGTDSGISVGSTSLGGARVIGGNSIENGGVRIGPIGLPVVAVSEGVTVAFAPGAGATSGATGNGGISGNGATAGLSSVSAGLPGVIAPGGVHVRLHPDASATSGAAGTGRITGSGSTFGVGPTSITFPAGAGLGGVAAGLPSGSMATGVATGFHQPLVGGSSATAGSIHSGGGIGSSTSGVSTTSLGATGGSRINVAFIPAAAHAGGNAASVGSGFRTQGGSYYMPGYIVYGVPPSGMLSSGILPSSAITYGPVVYSNFTDFRTAYPGGVDTGEAPETGEAVTDSGSS
ncbi:uncharacterized PE-PGRS family protein PE_PGRS3-like [Dermacentor silvarum]|uniref:uncharacterized PE-PGRS family protein PE_PGRS3-like n=1 Tax=Dermacentor silvarum TaxID=543639 RepID=UPI00210176B7|nr:uncharacterized PE-PGRS family protein PE_PGRS3-like [Dermacentor silvarum]